MQIDCLFINKTFYILTAPLKPTDFVVEIMNTATIVRLIYKWTFYTTFTLDYFVINLCYSGKDCEDAIRLNVSDFYNPLKFPKLTQKHQQTRTSPLKAGHYLATIYSTSHSVSSNKIYYNFTVGKYCMRNKTA